MKKVGIVTLTGNNNYGNRLQNYALSKKINEKGYKTYTLWFNCNPIKYKMKDYLKIILAPICKNYRRYSNFAKFTNKYIKNMYIRNVANVKEEFYKFVTGSDQVWNYNFKSFNEDMLLTFSKNEKNIAYSASFGVEEIENNYKQLFKNGLNNIKYISVREEKGKELVKSVTDRDDVEVLLDPTMLLDAKQWNELAKKNIKLKKNKYILNYFLGDLSEKRRVEIEKFAIENDCEIINLLDKNGEYYNCGPSEFLYLEENAYLICTDSFHSSVFAILFNRPFVVFDREDNIKNMNSRIETLLSKFKLNDRKYSGRISADNIKCDYQEAYKILEIERRKANDFLERALKTEEIN